MNLATFESFADYSSFVYELGATNRTDIVRFYTDADVRTLLHPNGKGLKALKKLLAAHSNGMAEFFHGTHPSFDILGQGLLKTTARSKKSMQSTPGFVYLATNPSAARTFGNLANGINDAAVYRIVVPLAHVKADLDQLSNKRHYGNFYDAPIGNSLADSLVFGGGGRVKGNIPPYMITRFEE